MIPWEHLASTSVPHSKEPLTLHRRGAELSIRVGGTRELMNSRMHASEDALGDLGARAVADRPKARILVGGLGMGFTLAAALKALPADAEVVVAELVAEVVTWNRGPIGPLADHPLDDPRVRVVVGDVGAVMADELGGFDAILLDVDNGPEGLTRPGNDSLYNRPGLLRAAKALRRGGVLGVWSAKADPAFARRLAEGYRVEEARIRARGNKGGTHVLWLATPTR